MTDRARPARLEWEVDVPLLTNRHFLGGFAKAMLGSGFLVAALVSFGLALQGEWRAIPGVAGLLLAAAAGLLLVGLLVMAVPFRNRMRTRFTVDGEGIGLRVVDAAARAGSRGTLILGAVLGSASTAGAGLLAATQEERQLRWTGAFRAVPEPGTRTVALRSGWRTVLRVHCTPEGFAPAVAAIAAHMQAHGTADRVAGRSPLAGLLLRTGLVVVAMLPVFAARETFGYGMLAPWILFCFAVATVWLVRPLAWAVLLGEVAVVALAVAGALEPRRSWVGRGTYRRYEVLSGDDGLLAALAVAGLAWLAWLSVATLSRRIRPALEGDRDSTGEA